MRLLFILDEVEEDDDQVHAFQIDDAKIDVSPYVNSGCDGYSSIELSGLPNFRM
jgi:hypothetical protein